MADGELDITSPERLKAQKGTKMKTYIVKDKTGHTGSIKEIYANQYDSRRHILISEAGTKKDSWTDDEVDRMNKPEGLDDYAKQIQGAADDQYKRNKETYLKGGEVPSNIDKDIMQSYGLAKGDKKSDSDDEDPVKKYGTHEIEFADKPGQKFKALGKDKDDMRPFNDMQKVNTKPANEPKPEPKGGYEEPDAAKIQADADAQYKKNKDALLKGTTSEPSKTYDTPTFPEDPETGKQVGPGKASDRWIRGKKVSQKDFDSMKEMFSAEELAHINSIMEANPVSPTDPEFNRTARKVANTDQVGSSLNTNVVSSRDLTDETIREDYEYGMARNELATADRAIDRLMKHLKGEGEIEAWVQSKITKASDYLDTVADYMDGGKVNEEFKQIDEISKETLGSYVKGAVRDVANKQYQLGSDPNWKETLNTRKLMNRRRGIDKAVDKLTNEETLDEGRGRPPKQGSAAWHRQRGTTPDSADSQEPANQGRDPRQHIQVIAGQAAAGRHMDFTHNDGSTSKITPAMGRRITSHLNGLKPAERQGAVNKMHDSSEGLKV